MSCPIHAVDGPMCDERCDDEAQLLAISHRCDEHAVEHGDEPRPNGELTLTKRCGVCGRTLGSTIDNVLRMPNHAQ